MPYKALASLQITLAIASYSHSNSSSLHSHKLCQLPEIQNYWSKKGGSSKRFSHNLCNLMGLIYANMIKSGLLCVDWPYMNM